MLYMTVKSKNPVHQLLTVDIREERKQHELSSVPQNNQSDSRFESTRSKLHHIVAKVIYGFVKPCPFESCMSRTYLEVPQLTLTTRVEEAVLCCARANRTGPYTGITDVIAGWSAALVQRWIQWTYE